MANGMFCAPNFVDADPAIATVTFSGGLWRPTLPLSNLANPDLASVARSVNGSRDSTRFIVDLGVPRDVRVAVMPNALVSRDATARVRGYADSALTTLICDSGEKPWYPVVYPWGSLPWGHPSWWDGKLSAEDAKGFPIPWIHIWPTEQIAQFWLVEIGDETNPLAYVDIPRLFLARARQPPINFAFGASSGLISATSMREAPGGKRFYTVRRKRRYQEFQYDYLPQDEALSRGFDLAFRLGIEGQFFWIFDPDDTYHMHRRAYLATLRQMPTESYPEGFQPAGPGLDLRPSMSQSYVIDEVTA